MDIVYAQTTLLQGETPDQSVPYTELGFFTGSVTFNSQSYLCNFYDYLFEF